MADNRAIGVFDSGLGGLTVVKELQKVLPNEDIIYFGDTGRVPYGTRSRDTIRRYALEDEKFLVDRNVKLIIAACGTVSSVAADVANNLPVPFFEVVSHSSYAAAKSTKNKIVGVIGTSATVNSEKHKEYIKKISDKIEVVSNACSLFVPLVEEGWFDENDSVVLETAQRYLEPIKRANADTLILGCTHYPVLEKAISKVLGEKVKLINSGTATALAVKDYLEKNDLFNDSKALGDNKFYVSDKPNSFCRIASILLGEKIDDRKVEQVDLSSI